MRFKYIFIFYFLAGNILCQVDMVDVEGGVFVQGLTEDQDSSINRNQRFYLPTYPVELWDFRIGQYEVTQGDWESIMGDNPSINLNSIPHPDKPVENLIIYSMLIYCNELSIAEGISEDQLVYYKDRLLTEPWRLTDYMPNIITNNLPFYINVSNTGYRLPTDSEWEYAARGGQLSTPTRSAGSNNPDLVAWYNENAHLPDGMKNVDRHTHIVGTKLPNELDIYDMSGNVWETTQVFISSYNSKPKCNPGGYNSENINVLLINKGEDINGPSSKMYLANREGHFINKIGGDQGFRLAQSLGGQKTCDLDYTITNLACDDEGTPTDPSDDTFSFDIEVSSPAADSVWLATDPLGISARYDAGPTTFGPYLISDGDLIFDIHDVGDTNFVAASIAVTAPEVCSAVPPCTISASTSSIICADNGTPSDRSDDTYTFDLLVTGDNTGVTWSISAPISTSGSYDISMNLGPYLVRDGYISFTITDSDDLDCSYDMIVSPPGYCSPSIEPDMVDINGGVYIYGFVEEQDSSINMFSHFFLPNSTVEIWDLKMGAYEVTQADWEGIMGDNPSENLNSSPHPDKPIENVNFYSILIYCNELSLTNGYSLDELVYYKDSLHNEPWLLSDYNVLYPHDEPFYYEFSHTGYRLPTDTEWEYAARGGHLSTPTRSAGSNNVDEVAWYLENSHLPDGVQYFEPRTHIVGTKAPNEIGLYDMTGNIWEATYIYTYQNSTKSKCNPEGNNNSNNHQISTISCGEDDTAPLSNTYLSFRQPFGSKGAPSQTGFRLAQSLGGPKTCDLDYNITNLACDDEGTPTDPSDDTFSFDIEVSSPAADSVWLATDPLGISARYDAGPTTFGPYLISDGDLIFDIHDVGDTNFVAASIAVATPEVCSAVPPCTISTSIIDLTCDDNDTPSDPADDTYTVDIIITGENMSDSWLSSNITVPSGNYDISTTFGPFLISDGSVTITFIDSVDLLCGTTLTISSVTSCSNLCTNSATATTPTCDDNGTPSDPSDDTYTFDLIVTGLNTGLTWSANDPSSSVGSYDNATTFGPYLISDGPLNITITDSDDPDCNFDITVTPPSACSDQCTISAASTTPVCDDNGTPSDPSDDTYTFDLLVTGSNTSLTWTANDPSSTVGNYDNATSFGPYLISDGPLIITITDSDDPDCTFDITVTPPSACSDQCTISAAATTPICDDNGTPSDPSDDTFTFDLIVSGLNTGLTWSANDPSSTVGSYDNATSFGPYLISDGPLIITITDSDDPDCNFDITVTPPSACSDQCTISAAATTPICDDNGTPSDPSDDTYTFDLIVTGLNTGLTWSANDPSSSVGSYDNATSFGPYLISDGPQNITITDNDDSDCNFNITIAPPSACSDQCTISAAATTPICDDNGTPSDPSDDTYTFDLLVTGSNTSLTWTANDPSSTVGNYDNATTFGPYLISDGPLNITITDSDDPDCNFDITVTPPSACSDQCTISATANTPICDDNGTPSDPSDDTYTFDLLVTGSNTGLSWTANDPSATIGSYDNATSLGPYLISDGPLNINVTDSNDPDCNFDITVTPPSACSDQCTISAAATTPICDDNGTPTDPSDDTYTFDLLVTGSNTGLTWSANDPLSTSGSYDNATTFGPYLISDGLQYITITDSDDPDCTFDITVTPPSACSDQCTISAAATTPNCDDNGTPIDPSDDTYTFDLLITGSNTSLSWTANDPSSTIGSYDNATTFGPYLISDGPLNITITDSDDPDCTFDITVTLPSACSNQCTISAAANTPICDDNGTPTDPSDDTFTVDIIISGDNSGAGWSANDPLGQTGSYTSQSVIFGPYPISGGDLSFDITDDNDPDCRVSVEVSAPSTCSTECTLSGTISNLLCNDSGTPSAPSDDTFTFDIFVSGSNVASQWTSDMAISGNYDETTSAGPFLISDGPFTINITDIDDDQCSALVDVTPPNSCSGSCSIASSLVSSSCDDSGTPSDPSDDTFTIVVMVSGSNTGTSWSDDRSNTGNYEEEITLGPFLISDGGFSLLFTDDVDPLCTSSLAVTPPSPCSTLCTLSAAATTPVCDDNGTPTDPSDDTFTVDIIISGDNSGAGWTANDPLGQNGSFTSQPVTFGPYPISGGDLSFDITDDNDPDCRVSVEVSAPSTCSTLCTITTTISNLLCNDAGTPSTPSDDTYTFDILVSGSNVAAQWTSDMAISGTYDETTSAGPFLISDGQFSINITDIDDDQCLILVDVTPPNSCSGSCSIASSMVSSSCDDSDTPSDPSDDTFTIIVMVSGSNTGTSWSDDRSNTGNYEEETTLGPFLISDGGFSLLFTDDVDALCTSSLAISPPSPCSIQCTISAVATTPVCDDNGTPTDPSDDTFTVDVIISGDNTGSGWTANDLTSSSGNYTSQAVTFGPYPINGGDLSFEISADDDPGCRASIEVSAPSTCSTECPSTVAINDTFTLISKKDLAIDVLHNDVYDLSKEISVELISDPLYGDISETDFGVFEYFPTSSDLEFGDSIKYEICYMDCPEICDTAMILVTYAPPITNEEVEMLITPNGDGETEYLVFDNISLNLAVDYPNNKLLVTNRWGAKVYSSNPYDNNWDGGGLPDGTYYYVLNIGDDTLKSVFGCILIVR